MDLIFCLSLIYFLVALFVLEFKKKKRLKVFEFPTLKLTKKGIVFSSHKQHKIKICELKILQYGDIVYLKRNGEIIIIKHVGDVFMFNDYLYFTGKGKVEILFDCSLIYKYFNIIIISEKFNLNDHKQMALKDIIEHCFQLKFCKNLEKYINIITKWLNISIFTKKIVIKQNKFHLPYTLKYKVNNKIIQLNINETLEE